MAKQKENQLVAAEKSPEEIAAEVAQRFPVMAMDPSGLKDLVESNLGTKTLRAFDLVQLKVPGAGSTVWEVPGIEGTSNQPTVEGIILHWRDTKARWKYEYGKAPAGEKQFPLCKSEDAIKGEGDPGILCAKCPFNQWVDDKAPACRNKRLLFVLLEGEMMPCALFLPQQSIDPCFKYFMGLLSKGLKPHDVVTSFSLTKEENPSKIKYAVARPKVLARLSAEQRLPVARYREAMMPVFSSFSVAEDEEGGAATGSGDGVESVS